ncbi:hypothetical protein [Fischerella sp. JS2]|uniref:hypothetical protein n=1 Tax=Fischerella sp. JS2 TaxID=2597771 RepID=UPI0028E18886|nr:hypothetical protein [Fischerella sp. JS2]
MSIFTGKKLRSHLHDSGIRLENKAEGKRINPNYLPFILHPSALSPLSGLSSIITPCLP